MITHEQGSVNLYYKIEGSCCRRSQKNPGQILGLVKKIPNFVKAIF
jgi:hypothetical protein